MQTIHWNISLRRYYLKLQKAQVLFLHKFKNQRKDELTLSYSIKMQRTNLYLISLVPEVKAAI